MAELEGTNAIVTGGGRGIGRAVAAALAAAGANVAVAARSVAEIEATAEAITSDGGRAVAVDVTDPASVRALAEEAEAKLGPVSLLVNNAGTPGPVGDDWSVDADEWWRCIETSVRAAFLCTQAVVPAMIGRGGGRIVNMASTSGTRAFPALTATSVAKTALIRLTEGLALSGAAHGVRAFAIHPGVVRTLLLDSYGFSFPEYTPPEAAGDLCVRLASGRYDALSGRFLQVSDDLGELVVDADDIAARDALTLRIQR